MYKVKIFLIPFGPLPSKCRVEYSLRCDSFLFSSLGRADWRSQSATLLPYIRIVDIYLGWSRESAVRVVVYININRLEGTKDSRRK